MARNWANSPTRTRALRVADAILSPLSIASTLSGTKPLPDTPRILVFEFWHLGDAVMAEPFLRALRGRFPRAEISLLCKPATRVLLEPGGMVDRFIEIDVPWTSFDRKYELRRYTNARFISTIKALRRERFDVTVDSRMDIRSNILARIIGASRRIGFDVPGGRGLLTDRVPDRGESSHKVVDWLAMLDAFGKPESSSPAPVLKVPGPVQAAADAHLRALGLTPETTLVALHPSARQAVRRWPLERFTEIAGDLSKIPNTRVVVFVDPDGYGESLASTGATCIRASLPALPAYLSRCTLFIGNDTGPAHIAAAVGCTTVTIFGPGAIEWFRPYGEGQHVIAIEPMPCRPCFDRCIRETNICLQSLSTARVMEVALRVIAASQGRSTNCVDDRASTGEIAS